MIIQLKFLNKFNKENFNKIIIMKFYYNLSVIVITNYLPWIQI